MNEQKDDRWLDEMISRTINTEKPEFDAEKWKQKYPDEFQALLSRAAKTPAHPVRWANFLKSPIAKFAAAAAIILTIAFLAIRPAPDKKVEIVEVTNTLKSPAEMLTATSLMTTYRHDGMEAMEIQMDEAIEKLEPFTATITVQELLAEINGT